MPDRVLRAISAQTIDHRGPEFALVGKQALDGMKSIFKITQDVIIYPASGTGAWEAALVNVLSQGERVLMYETGHFAALWTKVAAKLELRPNRSKATGAAARILMPSSSICARTRGTR